MATERHGGTQTAVPGTLHALHAEIDLAGTYQLSIDVSVLAGPIESLSLFATAKVRAGAVARTGHLGTAPFGTGWWRSEPIPVGPNEGLTFSLKQNGGSNRDFVWSVKAL